MAGIHRPDSLTRKQVRDVDRRAIEDYGIPGVVLMENAGRGAAEWLLSLGCSGPVAICAGKGNNGGDGFVIARHLAARGIETRVILFCDPNQLQGDAAINYQILVNSGLAGIVAGQRPPVEWLKQQLHSVPWIVDALLGTGTRGSIREPFRLVIDLINAACRQVFAVDLPSGMDCDTGREIGPCVRADYTATFVARKAGFDARDAHLLTGNIRVLDVGIPPQLIAELC